VYAAESTSRRLTLYVDVRHPRYRNSISSGSRHILFLVAALFASIWAPFSVAGSPKFFGSGAVNLDFLAKRKSELWVLSTGR